MCIASSIKAHLETEAKRYRQVLWLDGVDTKYVEEVGTMNVLFVIDGVVVTTSLKGYVLTGITRDSMIHLLKSKGYKVE